MTTGMSLMFVVRDSIAYEDAPAIEDALAAAIILVAVLLPMKLIFMLYI